MDYTKLLPNYLCIYMFVFKREKPHFFFNSITFVFSPCDLSNCSSDLIENCHSLEIWPVNQEVRTLAQKPDAGIFVLVKTREMGPLGAVSYQG